VGNRLRLHRSIYFTLKRSVKYKCYREIETACTVLPEINSNAQCRSLYIKCTHYYSSKHYFGASDDLEYAE